MANNPSILPIDFDFLNENEENVMFITDGKSGQKMTLGIKNTSNLSTTLKKLTGKTSSVNHHFEIVFRPGTLSDTKAAPHIMPLPGKEVSGIVHANSDGTQTVFYNTAEFEMMLDLDANGKINSNSDGTQSIFIKVKKPWSLIKNQQAFISLTNINPDSRGGTRGTRVLIKYKNMLHSGRTDTFSGYREVLLNIINHQGKKSIPMKVGFIGSNRVLNFGDHPNTLKFRITNTSKKNHIINTGKNSRMIISFDSGPKKEEWALADANKLTGIEINATYPDGTTKNLKKPTGSNEWTIPFKSLPTGKSIDLVISKIVTNHPTGFANIYIYYEDIPGYSNGELVSVIEKSPLVTRSSHVGIMTANPNANLEVDGKTNLKELYVKGKISLDPSTSISVNYKPFFTAHNKKFIEFKTDYVNNARGQVHFYAPSNYYKNVPALTLAGNYGAGGKVGIGITSPSSSLDVKGIIKSNGNNISPASNKAGINILTKTAGNTHLPHTNNWNYISGKGVIFRDQNNNEKIRIDGKSGNLGIGVNPTKGRIEVSGWASYQFSVKGGVGTMSNKKFGTWNSQRKGNWGSSIYAQGKVVAHSFLVPSDVRTKEITKKSDSTEDLAVINKIEIIDYKMKDVIAKGDTSFKKVIAQQVNKVYPLATTKSKDVVPDIYKHGLIENGWIGLETNLKLGEKVQLIFGTEKIVVEVLNVEQDKFKVGTDRQGDVFVYGREVDDFMSVDYEAISMLNVSATQALSKQVDNLILENKQLKTKIELLEKKESETTSAFEKINERLLMLEKLEVI